MKQEQKQLNFPALVAIAAGGTVAGIFSSIGLATEQTGRSAWIAYGLAVLIGGVLRVIPVLVFTSMFRYQGGNYTLTTLTLGPLAGWVYSLWWLPMFLSRGVTASALGQYISSVFPQISPICTSVVLTTMAFVVNLFWITTMTKLQQPLTVISVGAMLMFTFFGLVKLHPGSFDIASPEYYSHGRIGLLLAVALVIQPTSGPSLLCGFSWQAKDSKRNVPLAILTASGLVFLIFVGVSFVAGNALPTVEIAGKPMTYTAQQILPGILFPAFLILGPVLALCSGLNSGMASIAALRRRGFTPESIQKFVELCGVSKANSSVDYAMLEYCIREDLKLKRPRMMAVLDPVKLVIDNYPEGETEYLDVENNLENPELGMRQIPFGRELYIEREDFMIEPPKKYFRLFPGNEVRLMHAYFVKCVSYETDEEGNVTVVHCTYDPETKCGTGFTGRKVKGTIHWVAAEAAKKAEVRLYENLVDEEKGVYNKEDGSLNLNPNSLTVCKDCFVEDSFADAKGCDSFQFVRNGYFCIDSKDSTPENLVFNRIVSLKSSFKLPK